MSKIFEALQYAQAERLQANEVARHPKEHEWLSRPTKTVEPQKTKPVEPVKPKTVTSCRCAQHSARVRRQGIRDFLFRFIGSYPWQCWKCGRLFHRWARQ